MSKKNPKLNVIFQKKAKDSPERDERYEGAISLCSNKKEEK
jgi:hypothetical protein